jgi:hypothetical protein
LTLVSHSMGGSSRVRQARWDKRACCHKLSGCLGVVCVLLQVGMGATLLDGVVMESGSIVAAGAVVPPGARELYHDNMLQAESGRDTFTARLDRWTQRSTNVPVPACTYADG